MKVNLSKDDLVNLVCGIEPTYEAMEHPLLKQYGKFFGGFNSEWSWDRWGLKELDEHTLFTIYNICKLKKL